MKKQLLIQLSLILFFSTALNAQYITNYPHIPRIDVHAHPHSIPDNDGLTKSQSVNKPDMQSSANFEAIANYLRMSDTLKSRYKTDLAMWISLGGERSIDSVNLVSNSRIMTCISDYAPQRGLSYKPADIKKYHSMGFAGYKMWFAPYWRRLKPGEDGIKYFDDPANEPVLAAMEKAGMVGASIHIADPNGPFGNRGEWCADPIEFWRMQIGIERVLQRHQKLVIVAAHGCWLVCQDAQLDFLRYLFKTYPNFYVDLAATDQYYNLVNYDNLRNLFIEFSDRILFGTDIGKLNEKDISEIAERYSRSFMILESNEIVNGSYFGDEKIKGLGLPEEVLENIYYKNAIRIYPGLKERMNSLGYKSE
ncbi:MAG: amidohydrolase family protein [Bacteroidia bacterium]|nr:amidohydrolase family protein [Bacteroidia bacterium]